MAAISVQEAYSYQTQRWQDQRTMDQFPLAPAALPPGEELT